MVIYDNSRYTYEQVLAGAGYYMQDSRLRLSTGVKTMQEKLNHAGYHCGTPDGKFGSGTDRAVRHFQKAKNLSVDGKAGKGTLAALEGAVAGGGSPCCSFHRTHGSIIQSYADAYGIAEHILGGFLLVESGGSGFTNGKLKIRLENHHFLKNDGEQYKGIYFDYGFPAYKGHIYRKNARDAWSKCHQNQTQEHDAFSLALSLNAAKAYESISMGLAQIMGFHYSRCGYGSAQEMYDAFSTGETVQLEGFIRFIVSNEKLLKACRKQDYHTMACLYNGSGNANAYASKIEAASKQYAKSSGKL